MDTNVRRPKQTKFTVVVQQTLIEVRSLADIQGRQLVGQFFNRVDIVTRLAGTEPAAAWINPVRVLKYRKSGPDDRWGL